MTLEHTQHYIHLGGSRVYYERYGAGPLLLLVHGLSGSGTWWRRNVPALAAHFTVIVIDLVGFGRSRKLRPLPLVEAADLLAALIDALGYERACVLAHSMGGHISLLLAARHPARVERLVLAAAAGGPALHATLVEMSVRAALAGLIALDFVPVVLWDSLRAGPMSLWVAARELLAADLSPLLPQVVAPVLLIWGDRDLLLPLAVGEALHAALPGSSLVVLPGAGHVLMYDHAAAFNAAVLEFLMKRET